ncbi:di-heme oxidoredictase family protein [Limnobacter sp.]|uniref:di-heme oxidoredictase family protein n=1 Tax=Limnobacter sp. TaxID=2003368 RepID=UPI003517AF57
MKNRHVGPTLAMAALLAACSTEDLSNTSTSSNPSASAAPAGPVQAAQREPVLWAKPMDGLDAAQLERFEFGKALFEKVFEPSNGLGAVFNAQSCAECHGQPATGGTDPSRTISRFTTLLAPQFAVGLLTQADGAPHVHARSVADEFPAQVPGCNLAPERVPDNALASTVRATPHLFGIGLIEAIPDSAIIANGQAAAQAYPEVSGRAGAMFPGGINDINTTDQAVGRFGARGFVADVLAFTQGAFSTELGIATSHPVFSVPVRPSGNLAPVECTPFVGEAVTLREAQLVADFQRWLAPPPRPVLKGKALRGEQVFKDTRCVACHTPMLKTAANLGAPMGDREVWLYSDLLLHDLGPELADNAPEGLGTATEWKTPPLWGVGQTNKPLLHDGRAGRDFDKAIRLHGGEANTSKALYEQLSKQDRQALIEFLKSL